MERSWICRVHGQINEAKRFAEQPKGDNDPVRYSNVISRLIAGQDGRIDIRLAEHKNERLIDQRC